MTSKTTVLSSSLASAIVGGLLGGMLVATMAPEPAKPAHSKDQRTETRAAHDPDVTALETKVAELEGRLQTLQRRQNSRQALEQYARQLSKGDDSTKADNGKTPAPGSVDAEDPAFELAVRSVLDRVDWERNEEQRLVGEQRRSERAERQTKLLTQRLVLSPEQASRVSEALTQQMDRFRALREGNGQDGQGQPATRSEWRKRVDEIRGQTEKDLSGVLDDKQLEGYHAFVENEGLGGPGGFGRGRQLRARSVPSAP
jgi:hypothetical protein